LSNNLLQYKRIFPYLDQHWIKTHRRY